MCAISCDHFASKNKHEPDEVHFSGFSDPQGITSLSVESYANSCQISFQLESKSNQAAEDTLKARAKTLLAAGGFTDVRVTDYGNGDFYMTVQAGSSGDLAGVVRALSSDVQQEQGVTIHGLLAKSDALAVHRSNFKAQAQLLQEKADNGEDVAIESAVTSLTRDDIYKHEAYSQHVGQPRYYDADLSKIAGGTVVKLEESGSYFVPDVTTQIVFADEIAAQAAMQVLSASGGIQKPSLHGTGITLHGRLPEAIEALGNTGILPQVAVDHLKQQHATEVHGTRPLSQELAQTARRPSFEGKL